MGHVLSGWDGSNALGNPTDLCAYTSACVRFNMSLTCVAAVYQMYVFQTSMLGFVILRYRFAAWTAFHHTSLRAYSGVIHMKTNFPYVFTSTQ